MKSQLFLIFYLFMQSYALKFNHPRILLPIFDNVRINYSLEVVEKGCFDFRISSGAELIQIQPIYDDVENDCSHRVQITAISREKQKKTAIVLAESKLTGEVLRCDVILDVIHSIFVHTTTRELYLEEAPETFTLNAHDSQGNDFTTLEGVEFNWSIGTQSRNTKDASGKAEYQVLRFLTFSESKYHQVPKEVEKFDTMGLKGHMTLIEGINSGTAKVNVKLPYPEYQHVQEVTVDITVLANLIIYPNDVHVMVDDTTNFKVLQLKQGKLHEVTLGPQYYLEIERKEFAKIDKGLATGLKLGTTLVLLRDKNVIENSENPPLMPKAKLTVSEASKITINLLPFYNWVTVEGQTHEIAIDLFTKNNDRITLGDRYKIESKFDTSLFRESSRNINGSRIDGNAVMQGSSLVSGNFKQLTANAEMVIYGKIDLVPREVFLPYDVNKPVDHKIRFFASGGDGSFTWSSANPTILPILQDGQAESHLRKIKDFHHELTDNIFITSVKAAMSKNPKIYKSAKVYLLPPVKLEIVAYNFETSVHDYIDVHVGLFAFYQDKYVPFTSCENLNFGIDFGHQLFVVANSDSDHTNKLKNSCRIFRLRGNHAGLTTMTVSYHHGNEILSDSVQLMVNEKLVTYNPESNIVVLPIGSSRNVIYQFGPKKVYTVGSDLIKEVDFSSDIAEVTEIKADFQDQRFGYNVLCRKVGETKLKLNIFNSLNQPNFIKYVSSLETTIYCVKPRFINLHSLDKLKTSCPIDSKSSLLHVRSMQDALDIEIEVLDQQKRKLDNITSLVIDWKFLQTNGVLNHNIVYNRENENDEIDGVIIPKRDYLRTSITEANVNHKIKAIVREYDSAVLEKSRVRPEVPAFGIPKSSEDGKLVTPLIENELDFLSFDSALLPVSSVSVFLSTGVEKRIRLGRGSGFYDIKVKHSSIVDVQYDKTTSELVLKPKIIGETVVEIADKCLKIEASKLHVSIVGIGRIELTSPDRVERTKTIEAIARLYDSNDQLMEIDFDNLNILRLSEKVFNEHILSIVKGSQNNLQRGEIRYAVTGNELGETKIIVSSGAVTSAPVAIQVFPPLQLLPRNATILVGSHLEIRSKGGPRPNTNVIYSIANSEILSIDGSVVEGLKVGKTKVVGKSVGINPTTGSTTTFTEDFVYINVVPLNKIKIKTPLQRLKSGSIMPITLWADNDISPMILGTLKNLRIKWQVDAPDIVELRNVFEDFGVSYGESDAISMRIHGLKQGKAKITATAYHFNNRYQSTIDITVFKTLELESPKKIVHDPIIIPPRMTVQLKTNLEDTTFEINEQADRSVINVSKDGMVKSYDMLGTSLVVASSASSDQKLDIPVEVKNINYIMASVVPNVQMKSFEQQLTNNLNFEMTISLHDNLGNKFSHTFEDLKWQLSSRDSVEAINGENFTLSIRLLRPGSSMLAVSLRDSTTIKNAEDFIKLSVKQSDGIFSDKLFATLGDIICFNSPLNNNYKWQTNSDAITLHGSVGRVTKVPGNQRIIVSHGLKDSTRISYEVQVRNPDRIQLSKKIDTFNGELYYGHFVVSHHQQIDKVSNIIASNRSHCEDLSSDNSIDFVGCKLTSDDSTILKKFEVSTVFDQKALSYACEIQPLVSLEEITSYARGKDIRIVLEARLTLSGVFDRSELRLTPAIQIFPRSLNIDKLHQDEITISGIESILQKVEIESSHPENLLLIPSSQKTVGRLQYRTKLQNAEDVESELFIRVKSPLTQQTIQIPILPPSQSDYDFEKTSWIILFLSNTGKIIASTVLALAVIGIVFMFYRNRDLDTSGIFRNSRNMSNSNQTLVTNHNGSNSGIFSASPLQSQRSQQPPSPIRASPNHHQEDLIYGNTTIPSPYRRFKKNL